MKKRCLSALVWTAVWAFWLFTTHHFHPTLTLALIVTTSLVIAYALAYYINQHTLIPRLLRQRKYAAYVGSLAVTMMALTAIALLIIRVSYRAAVGPDADPYGAYKHFAIDLFGMAVHLLAGFTISRIARYWTHRQQTADAYQESNDPS